MAADTTLRKLDQKVIKGQDNVVV